MLKTSPFADHFPKHIPHGFSTYVNVCPGVNHHEKNNYIKLYPHMFIYIFMVRIRIERYYIILHHYNQPTVVFDPAATEAQRAYDPSRRWFRRNARSPERRFPAMFTLKSSIEICRWLRFGSRV